MSVDIELLQDVKISDGVVSYFFSVIPW